MSGKPLSFGSGFYLHVIGYFIAAALCYSVLGEKRTVKIIAVLGILFAGGIAFEVIQVYLPKRTSNLMDIAANGVGLATFYICVAMIRRSKMKRNGFHFRKKEF